MNATASQNTPPRKPAQTHRLVGMILADQDDLWHDGRRYFRPENMALIDAGPEEVVPG